MSSAEGRAIDLAIEGNLTELDKLLTGWTLAERIAVLDAMDLVRGKLTDRFGNIIVPEDDLVFSHDEKFHGPRPDLIIIDEIEEHNTNG